LRKFKKIKLKGWKDENPLTLFPQGFWKSSSLEMVDFLEKTEGKEKDE